MNRNVVTRATMAGGVLLAMVSLAACRKGPSPAAGASDAAAPTLAVASTPTASGKAEGKVRTQDASVPKLSMDQRKSVIHELRLGRQHAKDKEWDEALAAFDRALALEPKNPRVLAEMGWVAFQANDSTRAADANKRALATAGDPKLRAQILYNTGRVAEAEGAKDAAKKAYNASLALRDNAQVKKRLESMGGVIDATRDLELPCLQAQANIEQLCSCLNEHREVSEMNPDPFCEREPTPAMPDPRITVIQWGSGVGEVVHMLVAREGPKVRIVADLGRDFEPGAMGIHNGAEVTGAEIRTVAQHKVLIVRSTQFNNDENMGGLELYANSEKLETLCALADGPGATKCTPAIPVESSSSYGLGGAYDDASDVGDEWKEMAKEIQGRASSSHSKSAWNLTDDGKVMVRVVEGKETLAKSLQGPHALW